MKFPARMSPIRLLLAILLPLTLLAGACSDSDSESSDSAGSEEGATSAEGTEGETESSVKALHQRS